MKNNKGFTLVELIVVIGILVILMVIAIPSFNSYTEKVREQVCDTNCRELDRIYRAYLITEGLNHINQIFEGYIIQYGKDICPEDGNIRYDNGQVRCSLHTNKDEDDEEEVPYL